MKIVAMEMFRSILDEGSLGLRSTLMFGSRSLDVKEIFQHCLGWVGVNLKDLMVKLS